MLSLSIMRERLRWLGHVLPIKDDRLAFLANHQGPNKKISLFQNGLGCGRKEGFKENWCFLGGCAEEGFEKQDGGGSCVTVLTSDGLMLQ